MKRAVYSPARFLLTGAPDTETALRQAQEQYFRELHEELDALETECRSEKLEKYCANLAERAKNLDPGRDLLGGRDFDPEQDGLLELALGYGFTRELIREARAAIEAGKFPAGIDYIRGSVRTINQLRLDYSEHQAIWPHLAGQSSQRKQYGSPKFRRRRRAWIQHRIAEVEADMEDIGPLRSRYTEASKRVAKEVCRDHQCVLPCRNAKHPKLSDRQIRTLSPQRK